MVQRTTVNILFPKTQMRHPNFQKYISSFLSLSGMSKASLLRVPTLFSIHLSHGTHIRITWVCLSHPPDFDLLEVCQVSLAPAITGLVLNLFHHKSKHSQKNCELQENVYIFL